MCLCLVYRVHQKYMHTIREKNCSYILILNLLGHYEINISHHYLSSYKCHLEWWAFAYYLLVWWTPAWVILVTEIAENAISNYSPGARSVVVLVWFTTYKVHHTRVTYVEKVIIFFFFSWRVYTCFGWFSIYKNCSLCVLIHVCLLFVSTKAFISLYKCSPRSCTI